MPGKQTLTQGVEPVAPVQARGELSGVTGPVHRVAASGVAGSGQALPHLDTLQRAFGRHDLSGVRAHVGGDAATASARIGAQAYASGENIAFASSPDLYTTAHEAAHVVQQRGGVQLAGGVGQSGDRYEQQADQIADRVVRGESAAELLGEGGPGGSTAVQRQDGSQDEGTEPAHWIVTYRAGAKLRDAPASNGAVRLEFPNYNSPLYYVGHWKNNPTAYDPGGGETPKFPLRWLEVQFQHPDWSTAVQGWMHSGVTHYPDNYPQPTPDALRQVVVTGGNTPATSGGTGGGGGTQNGPAATPGGNEVPADQLEVVGAGIDAPAFPDSQDPLAALARLPRIKPFVIEGQGNGVDFQKSPNVVAVGPSSRVSPSIAVIGIVHGRSADYKTYEFIHQIKGGKVRRSNVWLVCEFEAGTYFVHAGATLVNDMQLAAALGAKPPATSASGGDQAGTGSTNTDDWTEEGPHLATLPASPTPDAAAYQAKNGFLPSDQVPSGYVAAGATLTASTRVPAVPLRRAPVDTADHIPPLLAQGAAVTIYGLVQGAQSAWFRAAVGSGAEARYGWIAAASLVDADKLAASFGAALALAAQPTAGGDQQLAGVQSINVINPAGADVLTSPRSGTLVAHLAPGFGIAHVYEVVVGQTVTRPAGVSSKWLRIGLKRDSAPDVIPGYIPALDTSIDGSLAATSGGGGSTLQVTVITDNVYVYSTPAFQRDAQLNAAALAIGQALTVLWQETSLDGKVWLRARTDTPVGTLEGYVAASRTSYQGGAPTPPVRHVDASSAASGGASGGGQTVLITAKRANLRRHAGVEPGDTPVGYLPTTTRVTVLMQFQSTAQSAMQPTDTGTSNLWLYIEVPADKVQGEDGQPLADPPQRAWLFVGATNMTGGSEALSSAPGNDGADALQMPANRPSAIDGPLTPGMTGDLVQMAKTQLVIRRFMTTAEFRTVAPDYYSDWTSQAVRSFQLIAMPQTGLQDGIITPQVWQALFQTTAQTSHMSQAETESVLASVPGAAGAGNYLWESDTNPYVHEHLGSANYWGPGILGGECTWFVWAVFPGIKPRMGAGAWPQELADQKLGAPQAGAIMNKGSHVAIVTGADGDGKHISVIECNWNFSRAVDVRQGVPVTEDMTFYRPR